MGQYCGDTVGNEKFNVGEFWVDLRCVCITPLTSGPEQWTSFIIWCRAWLCFSLVLLAKSSQVVAAARVAELYTSVEVSLLKHSMTWRDISALHLVPGPALKLPCCCTAKCGAVVACHAQQQPLQSERCQVQTENRDSHWEQLGSFTTPAGSCPASAVLMESGVDLLRSYQPTLAWLQVGGQWPGVRPECSPAGPGGLARSSQRLHPV